MDLLSTVQIISLKALEMSSLMSENFTLILSTSNLAVSYIMPKLIR